MKICKNNHLLLYIKAEPNIPLPSPNLSQFLHQTKKNDGKSIIQPKEGKERVKLYHNLHKICASSVVFALLHIKVEVMS
jgi:hypothetical protein